MKKQCRSANQLEFLSNDRVLAWDHRHKAYSIPATVTSNMTGDDGYSCSYNILTDEGVLRQFYARRLVPEVEDPPTIRITTNAQ